MASVRPAALAVIPVVAAAALYAAMWLGYRQGWAWLNAVDSSSLQALHDIGVKHPLWVRFWELVSEVLSPTAFRVLGAVAAAVALVKRQLRAALFLVLSVQFSELVMQVGKGLANRPRPPTALVSAAGSSFPSGHALTAMVGVLALLTVLLSMLSPRTRVPAAVAGALIVLAVGFSRVALNVHYPSDVLAGWALGYLYFVLCLGISGLGRCRRHPACGRVRVSGESRPACPPPA
jgi:membrane-associated phospholipid phosphatase